MVLVPESAGKTADNGYGRNWYRIFTELDQKLSAINHKKEISNDKEKKALKDLESQTDKLAKEFYTYCMRAAEAPFKKILSDDEISNKFEDVKDLVSSAMDVLTRATVEESNVEDTMREKTEGYDHKVASLVFPLNIERKSPLASDAGCNSGGLILLAKSVFNDVVSNFGNGG